MARKHDRERKDRYFQMHHYMLKTDAWRGLSAAARAVYVQIGFRYNGANNGKIAFSVREAAEECCLAKNTANRAFKELIDLGFIEETRHGGLSRRKTCIASEWRLTAFKCDLTGSLKTSLFMQRGTLAREHRQERSRPQPSHRPPPQPPPAGPSTCPQCGKPFTPWRTKKFCSESCRKKAQTARLDGLRLSQTTVSGVSNDGTPCLKRRSARPSGVSNDGTPRPSLGGLPVSNDGTHIIYQVGRSPMQGGGRPPEEAASAPALAVVGDSRRAPPAFAALTDILPPPSQAEPADGPLLMAMRAPTAAEILMREARREKEKPFRPIA